MSAPNADDRQVERDIEHMKLEFVREMLVSIKVQVELGLLYADTVDLTGLDYSLRKHVAYLRPVITTVGELKEARKLARTKMGEPA